MAIVWSDILKNANKRPPGFSGISIDIRALGDEAVMKALNQLEGFGRTNIFAQAAKKSLVPVLNDIKARAPKDSGLLAKSFNRRSIKAMRGRKARGAVGARIIFPTRAMLGIPVGAKGFYPVSHEFGWKPRGVGAKIAPKRFVRGSLYDNKAIVFATLRSELWRSIRKILAKRGMTISNLTGDVGGSD